MSDVFYIGDTIMPADAVAGPITDALLYPFRKLQKNLHKPAKGQDPVKPAKVDPMVQQVYDEASKVHNLLVNAGIGEPGASYGTYAAYHESGAYSSPLYRLHNNATGIKFAGQSGAVKGDNGYAWWPGGLQGWAQAYAHELKKGANPAGAGNLEEFAVRLKLNHYYEDSYDNYLHGLKRARLVLKVIPAADRAGYDPATGTYQDKRDLDIPGSKDYSKESVTDWWNKRSNLEKGGIIAGTVVLLAALTKK
jgi:hypothetical protein